MSLIFASKMEVIDGKVVFYGPEEPDKEKAARLREQSDGAQEISQFNLKWKVGKCQA